MSIQRVRRLAEAARQEGLDAVVLMPGANLHYLLGLTIHLSERLALAIIPREADGCTIVLPALEQPRAEAEYRGGLPVTWCTWSDDEGPRTALRRAASSLIGRTVGVEFTAMRVLELRALEEAAGVHAVDADPALASLRMHKDADELALMREAARIVEAGLQEAIAAIRPGVTEREIAETWERAMRAAGSEGPSFATIVAAGPNSANPHHTTSNRPIAEGDMVILDGGATHQGYCSDITRTVVVGPASAEQRRIYELVRDANQAAFAASRPGTTGQQIDAAARELITSGGYGQYFIHRTGHGLGMQIHEPPYISSVETAPLGTGAVFTIEPGIYLKGVGGVRIEDDVVLTETGAERLTSLPRDLIELPL